MQAKVNLISLNRRYVAANFVKISKKKFKKIAVVSTFNFRNLPEIFRRLEIIRAELKKIYQKHNYILDGNLLGHIGEGIAKFYYRLDDSVPKGKKHIDGYIDERVNGKIVKKSVQVKLINTSSISVSVAGPSDYLLVFQITADHKIREVYNGVNFHTKSANTQSKRISTLTNTKSLPRRLDPFNLFV